jgi:hypothetical protein
MRTRDDLADGSGSSGISIRRIAGLCEWGGEQKDLTQSAQRRSTEVTEKNEVDSPNGISIVEFGFGTGN